MGFPAMAGSGLSLTLLGVMEPVPASAQRPTSGRRCVGTTQRDAFTETHRKSSTAVPSMARQLRMLALQ